MTKAWITFVVRRTIGQAELSASQTMLDRTEAPFFGKKVLCYLRHYLPRT